MYSGVHRALIPRSCPQVPLTDIAIRNAKPSPKKRTRLFDERALYLEVSPNGGKWWWLKYRHGGKEKRLSLDVYPDVSLKAARDRRDAARKLLSDGADPVAHRVALGKATGRRGRKQFRRCCPRVAR